jgi:hypothetical protein
MDGAAAEHAAKAAPAPAPATEARARLRVIRVDGASGDVASVRAAIEAKLADAREAVHAGARARLRVTVDARGRVTRVAVLGAADRALREALEALLGGLETGASPPGGAATFLVEVEAAG